MTELLTCAEMDRADRAAIAAGHSGESLMEAAGWQIARAIKARFAPRKAVILCGPGNNGGDGFVVARLLAGWGWPVRVGLLGERQHLKGDAAIMAARWTGPVDAVMADLLQGSPLVVDALFGAGLTRPLDGIARYIIETLAGLDVVAVDLPSGVSGDTGEILGVAPTCRLTVTFFRPKPGHVLLPGRTLCGELVVGDIGIPDSVLADVAPKTFLNRPELWEGALPWPKSDGHKYKRGHLLVAGGSVMTGAARLVARAARRAGAGLVTILAPDSALSVYRAGEPGTLVRDIGEWNAHLEDPRHNVAVIGPGLGVSDTVCALVLSALVAGKSVVLDADGLSSFAGKRRVPWPAASQLVLTPHDGEYARLFSHKGDRLTRARVAAQETGAVVLLKGPDTVIAAPDGRAAICDNAPATLATGGSGDVLAGIIGGLLAQGMAPFEAACAGAWIHGESAALFGPGLIAEDVIEGLPSVWKALQKQESKA